jgi:hypothetical protein
MLARLYTSFFWHWRRNRKHWADRYDTQAATRAINTANGERAVGILATIFFFFLRRCASGRRFAKHPSFTVQMPPEKSQASFATRGGEVAKSKVTEKRRTSRRSIKKDLQPQKKKNTPINFSSALILTQRYRRGLPSRRHPQ